MRIWGMWSGPDKGYRIFGMKGEDSRRKPGLAVRAERRRHGWSQEELAERAEVHPSFIGQLERGLKSARLATLRRIGTALGVAPAALLGGSAGAEYKPLPIERKILGLLRGRTTREQNLVYQTIRHLLRQDRRLGK